MKLKNRLELVEEMEVIILNMIVPISKLKENLMLQEQEDRLLNMEQIRMMVPNLDIVLIERVFADK